MILRKIPPTGFVKVGRCVPVSRRVAAPAAGRTSSLATLAATADCKNTAGRCVGKYRASAAIVCGVSSRKLTSRFLELFATTSWHRSRAGPVSSGVRLCAPAGGRDRLHNTGSSGRGTRVYSQYVATAYGGHAFLCERSRRRPQAAHPPLRPPSLPSFSFSLSFLTVPLLPAGASRQATSRIGEVVLRRTREQEEEGDDDDDFGSRHLRAAYTTHAGPAFAARARGPCARSRWQ